VALLALAPKHHVLLFALHHIVSDGWSSGIFARELAHLYGAFRSGQEPGLPELPIQYGDYAAWQRSWLDGERLADHLGWWTERLADVPVLQLPTDRPRPARLSAAGAEWRQTLAPDLVEALRALSRSQGATLFMTLLAAFKALLLRCTGQTDIAVATPVAGRGEEALEGLIGFFVNMLVLRDDLAGDPRFSDLLARVRDGALDAYARHEVPFAAVVEAVKPRRDLARAPLFQAIFALQNTPRERVEIAGLTLAAMHLPAAFCRGDLELLIDADPWEYQRGDRGEGRVLTATWVYSTALFDEATVRRMAGWYRQILEAIARAPTRRLSRLPESLLDADELGTVLSWSGMAREIADSTCLHQLFARQVARTPEAIALSTPDGELSFRALDIRANQLAHVLRSLGVGPEVCVGLDLDRSMHAVVALLGILKAGGAYVPLHPELPHERKALILRDTAAAVLIREHGTAASWQPPGANVVSLESLRDAMAGQPQSCPVSQVGPDHIAYVLYTSGSTGRPKGVLVPHRALHHLWTGLAATVYRDAVRPLRIAINASLSFDFSVGQLVQLCAGHTMCLIPQDVRRDPAAFVEHIRAHRLDAVDVTPTHLRALMGAGLLDQLTERRRSGGAPLRLLVGGEAFDLDSWTTLARHGLDHTFNIYGPTECTVLATACSVSASPTPVLGSPLPHAAVYVLDEYMRPVPPGIPGEVYIGGHGLGRGYLRRPALSAERFVPDPLGGQPGSRLYRTGDRARWREDGQLEFLGRLDRQVKVLGHRIELGEIEAVLVRHPSVREVVVELRELAPGENRLIAYVTLTSGREIEPATLRSFVQTRLPAPMVPATFVVLDELPRTRSDKLDRAALPTPALRQATGEYRAARTPMQELIAAIWMEVLGVARVSVDDSFFALGGHSLMATQVCARIRQRLAVELPVRAIFEAPTLAELAERVEQTRHRGELAPLPPLRRTERGSLIPLSAAQERLWFLAQLEPEGPRYNNLAALQIDGPLDLAVLARCFKAIIDRHEGLRAAFVVVDGTPYQRIVPEVSVGLDEVDLAAAIADDPDAVQRRAVELSRRPYDLTAPPLVRAEVLRLAPRRHVLLLATHHIVSDGWSSGIFARELSTYYAAFCRGREVALPALAVEHADFAVWQRSWLNSELAAARLAGWSEQLDRVPALSLPTDRPRPVRLSAAGARVRQHLDPELVAALRALARDRGATLFMILLAAFKVLLGRYSGQSDFAVGTPVAGRSHVELEGLIGFFVNMLVLRADLSGDPRFGDLVDRVRGQALDAYARQDVPFARLVEVLQPDRDLSRTPLFQALFAVHNTPDGRFESDQLTLTPLAMPTVFARTELELLVDEPSGPEAAERGLSASWVYSTALFDEATIRDMAQRYRAILVAITQDCTRRLSELGQLTPDESERVTAWAGVARGLSRCVCVHELFEAQVDRTPDAIALREPGRELSFAALDARANQLAHWLRSVGVGPEVRVGLHLDRSIEALIGVLGILKAGGAYVPLHPGLPDKRLAMIVRDTDVAVLITSEPETLTWQPAAARVIGLDSDASRLARQPQSRPNSPVGPDHLAYVLYTSGSTGQPRGVMVEHRAVHHLWNGLESAVYADESRPLRVGLNAPLSFDASVKQLLQLVGGHTLCLIPDDVRHDGAALLDYVADVGLEVMDCTPTHVQMILRAGGASRLGGLRLLIGGEALDPISWATLARDMPSRACNLYGPTECTVDATACPVSASDRPSLGRPLSHVEVHVLDEAMRRLPPGLPGQIYIGGYGLARGYQGCPQLSAERFVPDPFSGRPGARLYRTGDRARWRRDGQL
ncbi:MAG: amino acid adenylation domain-containing protein, partial [Myxococcota bacterium]